MIVPTRGDANTKDRRVASDTVNQANGKSTFGKIVVNRFYWEVEGWNVCSKIILAKLSTLARKDDLVMPRQ